MKKLMTMAAILGVAAAVLVGLRGLAQAPSTDGAWQSSASGGSPRAWSAGPSAQDNAKPIQADSRVVDFEKGRPLVERLQPDDKRLEVRDFSTLPFAGGGDDPVRELQSHTRRADVAVVARAVAMRSMLTQAQDWINSQVEFEVLDVLKASTIAPAIRVGQTLSLPVDGGTIAVAGKSIVARPRWARLPQEGEAYLLFLGWDKTQYRSFPASQTFEITENALVRLQVDANWALDNKPFPPDVAFDVVRAAAKLPVLKQAGTTIMRSLRVLAASACCPKEYPPRSFAQRRRPDTIRDGSQLSAHGMWHSDSSGGNHESPSIRDD